MRGRLYGHHFADHPDTFACRRAAVMAVQLRLGVLSEWRPGTGAADYYHPVSGGPAVSAAAATNLFIKFASHKPWQSGNPYLPDRIGLDQKDLCPPTASLRPSG